MAFTIEFDYRFDSAGFFDSPEARAALKAAAALWENIIKDEFDDVPIGTSFEIRNPTTGLYETIVVNNAYDDMVVFVGSTTFAGSTLAIAGPDGLNATGDIYAARVSSNFRDSGPVTDFEPWAGSISFDADTDWFFGPGTPNGSQSDFVSVAAHEIGHILGIGTSAAFDNWVVNDVFTGPNATAVNGGQGIPLESDHGHVEDGFAGDEVLLDPSLTQGDQVTISEYDKAILADIGYEIASFSKQGSTPAIATQGVERIFGTDVGDVINALGGNDTIQGADGNDELRGGPGTDQLFGQGGTDIFVIGAGDGQNVINDFNLSGEIIRLIDSGFATADAAAQAVAKASSNVSRLTFGDGTTVDVFHTPQSGTPLNASHFQAVTSSSSPPILPQPTPNSTATGDVVIDGTTQVGETLTAGTDDVADTNGLGSFSYLWLRDGAIIPNANEATYTLTTDDEGAQIQVRVSFTDGIGNQEMRESAVTSDIQAADPPAIPDEPTSPSSDTGSDESPTDADSGGDTDAPDATGDTNQTMPGNSSPTGLLVILGDALVGETLTARPNGLKDVDGIDSAAQAFQWLRDGEVIQGATGSTYDVTVSDQGSEISLRYSYTDLGGSVEIIESLPKPTVPTTDDTSPDTPDTGGEDGDTDAGDGQDGGSEDDGQDADGEDGGGDDETPPEDDNGTDGVNDTPVTATPFNDVFTARSGLEVIDGGEGVDTVVFAGHQNSYTISVSTNGTTVIDRRVDGFGSMDLLNIERVDFEIPLSSFGGAVELSMFGGHASLTESDFESLIEMYIAYFNRAPDAIGLSFWGSAYANGTSLVEMARLFVDQDETRDMYPEDTSSVRFVADVYSNVLGRTPDLEGLQFWKNALDSGAVSQDEFILELLRGVDATPASDAPASFVEKQLADQAYLELKTDLGALFAVHRGMSDVDDAANIMAMFNGSQESLQTAIAAIDAAYAEAMDPEIGEFLMPLVGVLDTPFDI